MYNNVLTELQESCGGSGPGRQLAREGAGGEKFARGGFVRAARE
jgi:hypothetical protein